MLYDVPIIDVKLVSVIKKLYNCSVVLEDVIVNDPALVVDTPLYTIVIKK